MSEIETFFNYLSELEEEYYLKKDKDELSRESKILLDEAIEQNSQAIEKNIDLFITKKNKRYINDLFELDNSLKRLSDVVSKVREEVELNFFFKDGYNYDFDLLDELYKKKKIKSFFPKFNYVAWKKLLKNPILKIKNFNDDTIYYDQFLVRKIMIAINQMIFNEMDIYQIVCGKEGSGKSCFSSSLLLYYYTILKEANLIDYAYDITKLFFSSVLSLLDENNSLKNNDYFRIMTLDEANELNRLNFKDDQVKEFKQDMRVSRKQLKIMTINIQQLGELDISISLSRVNFIFDCNIDNDVKTGTLKKGKIDMYIIPRGDKIFSNYHEREFSRREIINGFSTRLDKKKDYYISLPKEFLIHQLNFNGVWGFNKSEYDEYIKNENKKRALGKELKVSDSFVYAMIKKVINAGRYKELATFDLENTGDKKLYNVFTKTIERWKTYFKLNPSLEKNYDIIYKQVSEKTYTEEETKQESQEYEDFVPKKFKEELESLPNITQEKPKKFYKDMNKN